MESKGIRTLPIVALALGIGVFFTAQASLMSLAAERRIDFQKDVVPELLFWTVWAAFSPTVLAAARRWPLDAKRSRQPLVAHLAISVTMAFVQTLVAFGLRPTILWLSGSFDGADVAAWVGNKESAMVWGLFMGIMFYALIVGTHSVLRYRALYTAEQMSAAELSRRGAALEAELAHAKLDALRSQLRPHFLFNTLNAISVLSQQDSAKTRTVLLRLASLLRRSLDEDSHEVALSQELSFLNEYLDIMRVRLGDRLDARVRAEADALEARVPVFLLQPLVENALEYGEGDDGQTRIVIAAGRSDDDLVIVLENSAASEFRGGAIRDGIGLGNTRARLRELYGDRAYVRLGPATQFFAPAGVRVELRLPFASTTAVNA